MPLAARLSAHSSRNSRALRMIFFFEFCDRVLETVVQNRKPRRAPFFSSDEPLPDNGFFRQIARYGKLGGEPQFAVLFQKRDGF